MSNLTSQDCVQGCRGHVYLLYISPMMRFNLLPKRNSQYKNADYFQRNARGGHLVFQNQAIFSPREAYPPMKISCKFGEPSWCSFPLRASKCGDGLSVVANAKPKYPPDVSGGYNNSRFPIWIILSIP